jgi:radical SAM protein with 4Fe4S-binding SPASM domain
MECKITLTTECGAKCKTCPSWKQEKKVMSYPVFEIIWKKLISSRYIHKIILNSTGDMSTLKDMDKFYDLIDKTETEKYIVMQTNAQELKRIPKVNHLVISFNGFDKESYEYTTGLLFEKVVENIKSQYSRMKQIDTVELHCLVWKGNPISQEKADNLLEIFKDFPGSIRISEKVENQMGEVETEPTVNREPCDYLQKLIIYADGSVIMCAHDFAGKNKYANLISDSIDSALFNLQKQAKLYEHAHKIFNGLCSKCNYNVPLGDRVRYLR